MRCRCLVASHATHPRRDCNTCESRTETFATRSDPGTLIDPIPGPRPSLFCCINKNTQNAGCFSHVPGLRHHLGPSPTRPPCRTPPINAPCALAGGGADWCWRFRCQSDGQFHVFKAGQNSVTYHDQYSDGGGATYSEWSAPSRPLPRAPSSSPWSENSPPFVVSPMYCIVVIPPPRPRLAGHGHIPNHLRYVCVESTLPYGSGVNTSRSSPVRVERRVGGCRSATVSMLAVLWLMTVELLGPQAPHHCE